MNSVEKGKRGELAAVDYLIELGYSILHQNYRASHAEIDIIATFNNIIVFVEVKTRKNNSFGEPENFVDAKKQKYLAFASSIFLEQIRHEGEIRFDIISIIMPADEVKELKHIKDAFFPGLV